MTPKEVLVELLCRLGARNGEFVMVSTEELNQWPITVVSALKSQNLLLKASPAKSVVCSGCEHECTMPVETLAHSITKNISSFVVCDKRSDINRVPIPVERITQWRFDANAVCGFVATSLAIQVTTVQPSGDGLLPIGMAQGKKRTQMLCLRFHDFPALVVNIESVSLADVIRFENDCFSVDQLVISQMVDAANTADPRYTPSTTKREARKIDTQAMYATWQKEYRALKKRRPHMSIKWYATEISKKPIAQGRDTSTIKKHMKS